MPGRLRQDGNCRPIQFGKARGSKPAGRRTTRPSTWDGDLGRVGGFLVLESRRAGELCGELKRRGVMTDYRGDCLRLGPAPYLSDRQLRDAVGVLGEVVRAI